MGGNARRQQSQRRGTLGMIERKARRYSAAPGMADDNRPFDADLIEHFTQDCRLILWRTGLATATFAPSHARPVNKYDAVTRGQRLPECKPHVFEIAAGAVDENDRRRCSRRDSELDYVLTQTPHVYEASARRMRASDQP